ncbi:MAG: EI24 domain-containing protein [Bacteroidetes bacterium]|nr:EI24 domain-containing protein [Bacteroidota bacterium]MBS1607634.1 EI24 domain-containing protein [Bacteroidota bacterium]
MLKEIVIAIQSYAEAHRFIVKNKLWKWILIPGIFYTILFIVSMYFFGKSATAVIEYLTHTTGLDGWLQKFQNGLLGFLFAFAGIILWLVLMLFYFSLFKYIWLIVGSPVFSYLSERTQSIIEGKEFPFDFKQLLKDAVRGTKLSLRNMIWQTVYSVSLLLLSLVPVAGWITPLVALAVECYYYGFSMMDYSCERQKLSSSQSVEFIGKHRGLAIGNGLVFYLMHGAIGIGWVLAPAYAVIAATLSLYKVGKD